MLSPSNLVLSAVFDAHVPSGLAHTLALCYLNVPLILPFQFLTILPFPFSHLLEGIGGSRGGISALAILRDWLLTPSSSGSFLPLLSSGALGAHSRASFLGFRAADNLSSPPQAVSAPPHLIRSRFRPITPRSRKIGSVVSVQRLFFPFSTKGTR